MPLFSKATEEQKRLAAQAGSGIHPWKKWGAYLSERSWGTVREDYSAKGDAWNYLSHDLARSKAYRWGEDGIAGFCDYFQTMAFSWAFWNGKDPILKERLFGLTPEEGNHGEDVKECYYYLDATPSQSYLKFLYKYPQEEFPYKRLVEENKKRTPFDREFELYDTGVFQEGKYFDIFIEYAKASPEDICIRIEVWNRSSSPASLHILPQLWFRNRWSWGDVPLEPPEISCLRKEGRDSVLLADTLRCPPPMRSSFPYTIPPMYLYASSFQEILFTHNETHHEIVWGSQVKSRTPYVKDAFHRYLVQKEQCVHPDHGSKAAFHYGPIEVLPHQPYLLSLRLTSQAPGSKPIASFLQEVGTVISLRKQEADAFYDAIHPKSLSSEDKAIQRGALAGMIWSQQLYVYDVKTWLCGDNQALPPPTGRGKIRNGKWSHLYACDVISMPDKWEYPWFASWDLAYHTLPFSLIDVGFAKEQLKLLLRHWFRHVNGQIPAYEWNFSDLNPPVQAWACWNVYLQEKKQNKEGDYDFLLFVFLKLVENLSWWVNKVDRLGNNLFEGGFLGLDNISVIDRSLPFPNGDMIEQSDATGWMGFYSLLMMRIALELAEKEPTYEALATNFLEQFIYISKTIHQTQNMWDEEDGFFYDIILSSDGSVKKLKIRSFVGIIPLYSILVMDEQTLKSHTLFYERMLKFREYNQVDVDRCLFRRGNGKVMFSLIELQQIQKILARVFDPDEFLSCYGLRSVSKVHEAHPLFFAGASVRYEPGESQERIKGGNSNWRGPIWFPTNFLVIDSLSHLIECLGEDFLVEDLKGNQQPLKALRKTLREALIAPFRKNKEGVRPVHGDCPLYQEDPYWKDLFLFYEHYHGETGRGLGASHQTGWSGLVANILQQLGED